MLTMWFLASPYTNFNDHGKALVAVGFLDSFKVDEKWLA